MKTWTREERYRVLNSIDQLIDVRALTVNSPFRQLWHVQPVCGLLNDPNGFMRTEEGWHLFYQWCPWGAVHGLKYWYHVFSRDLVHWKNLGIGLKPDTLYDNKGVYSGSALVYEGRKLLYYTGNHRTADWKRVPYTCLAEMKGDTTEKLPEPLFAPSEDYTEHQRDPKIVYDEGTRRFYIFIGAQDKRLRGRVIVYSSESPCENWRFAGELSVPGYEDFGGMWECPSVERIDGTDVLIFCPQYIKLPGRGEVTNHNGCILGKMDYSTLTFTPEGDFTPLDAGFDFYAAACAANTEKGAPAILSAWMGLPDVDYPTDEDGWQGCLSAPRELRVINGKLVQRPAEALKTLRRRQINSDDTVLPRACDIELKTKGNIEMRLFAKPGGDGGLKLTYDDASRTLLLSREHMDARFSLNIGRTRELRLDRSLESLRILLDVSSAEIFINGGEAVMTSRVFPSGEERGLSVKGDARSEMWELAASNDSAFIV